MYYTHEHSNKKFNTYEECEDDFEETIDIDEYIEHISVKEILRKYFRRKSNEEFCDWLDDRLLEVNEELKDDLIFEHEEESEE